MHTESIKGKHLLLLFFNHRHTQEGLVGQTFTLIVIDTNANSSTPLDQHTAVVETAFRISAGPALMLPIKPEGYNRRRYD